ncbi:MAG: hypothetical protein LBV40_05455 [Methanomicrobiales archaeon]|jgi:hypothetical protein|nr:hypothetical protein [Methanomicrobiales archaeon]
MAQFNDSTRRLIAFLLIVLVGSVLLLFDIPVLYLLLAVILIALVFALFTKMLIFSVVCADIREWLHKYRVTSGAQTEVDSKEEIKERDEELLSKKEDGDTTELGGEGEFLPRDDKKSDQSFTFGSTREGSTEGIGPSVVVDTDFVDVVNPENFDLGDTSDFYDLDDIAALDSDIGDVQTPFATDDVARDLSLDDDAKKKGSALDDDDISSTYASAGDTGENGAKDLLSNIEDGISTADTVAYDISDDSFYDYGSNDPEQEEQYETRDFSDGGVDDDLFASLKSDIDELKKKDNNVLLRDLKDAKFTAQDLVDDLNEIVTMITKPQK